MVIEKYDIVEVVSEGEMIAKEMVGWVGTAQEVPLSSPPCIYVEWAKDYCRSLDPATADIVFSRGVDMSLIPIDCLSVLEKGSISSYLARKSWSRESDRGQEAKGK